MRIKADIDIEMSWAPQGAAEGSKPGMLPG